MTPAQRLDAAPHLGNERDEVDLLESQEVAALGLCEQQQVLDQSLDACHFARHQPLDPPDLVPYTGIGADGGPEPWLTEDNRSAVRAATQKSIVLLKNAGNALPLDKDTLKSIAVIGPLADRVLLDWYSGTPPYAVTPLAGIREAVGDGVTVHHADGSDYGAAAELARTADVAIVCVGNHPTGGDNSFPLFLLAGVLVTVVAGGATLALSRKGS